MKLALRSALVAALAVLAWTAPHSAAQLRGDTGVRDASGGNTAAQTEQTIAVNPKNPRNVIIASINGLSVSHDGGRTWKSSTTSCGVDNNPTFDRSGVAYLECNRNGVSLYASYDGGDSWIGPSNPVTNGDNDGDFVDRPWVVRGRGPHGLVLGWESFFTNPLGWAFVKTSSDGGRTWSAARRVDDPQSAPAEQNPRQLPVVGADGTLYVVYASGHNPWPTGQTLTSSFVVARSSNGGVSFQRAVAAGVVRSSAPEEESEAISSLAADPHPRRARHLALVWADQRSGESRILVVTSVDGGRTWSRPADVADDPAGAGTQHDHPQVAFAPDGRAVVVWRDRRCCGDGGWPSAYQVYARTLTIGKRGIGARSRSVQVTAKPQQPNSSSMLDEYLGLAVGPEGVSVAWNQPRGGTATAFFRRIPLSAFT